ncbi:MAG: response regulator [Bacteroidales bacterium]|nr:response regulator [Bacteroidales bacterium]
MTNILFIDDNVEFAKSNKWALELEGYDIDIGYDGDVCLDMLKQKEYDILVLDILMPGTEGMETIRAVRKHYPGKKIIAISGGSGYLEKEKILDWARELGADRALMKPYQIKDLTDLIEKVLTE